MSVCYGALELKAGYQRNLGVGFVCSLLLSSSLFLAAHFFGRVEIFPASSNKHAITITLLPLSLSPTNSSPVEAVHFPALSTQTPKKGLLLGVIPIKGPILKWPKNPLFANRGLSKTNLSGVDGNAEDWADSLAGGIIDLDEFNLKPVVLYKADPKCPELARRGRITGTVTAEVLVGRDGLVREVSIKKSANVIFDDEVVAALRQWVFRPWVERNRCLPFRFTVMVEFVLR